MKLLTLAAVIALSSAGIVDNDSRCNGNISYEKEIIKKFGESHLITRSMSIDYDNNVLFYNYYENGEISAGLNLKTKESYNMTGIEGSATIVDPKTHKIYIKRSDGIYEFDNQTKVVRNVVQSRNIFKLFAKDGVYFTSYYHKVNVYKNGNVENVAEIGDTAMHFGLDEDDNIFFSKLSGLFFHKKGGEQTTLVKNSFVWSISVDFKGKLYFSTFDGIYSTKVTDGNVTITKLATIYGIRNFIIESDGSFICADDRDKSIVRLVRKCN